MSMVFHEMKKIWNPKILLVIALLCTLYYSIFLSFHIEHFPNGHPMTEDVGYSMELLQRYGLTLEEDEYAEFVQETRAKLIAEMEMHIQSNPVFAAAGIFSYEDYERLRGRDQLTEAENIAYWTLLGEESGFARFKMQALEWIESHYHHYPQYTWPILMSEAANQKERDRLAAIMETGEYRNIMNWHVYENTVAYSVNLAILSVLAVLTLVSPLIVTDRARNVHLLQYTAKQGRSILQKQLAAVLLSAFLLTTLLLVVFGAIYATNGTWVFWNSGLTSFLNSYTFWFEMTYGQYLVIYIVLLYVLCLGTAALAFVLSRLSRNLITLILKIIPVFGVLALLCGFVFVNPFSLENIIYRTTGIPGMEPFVCGLVFVAGVAASLYIVRREKKVDVMDAIG